MDFFASSYGVGGSTSLLWAMLAMHTLGLASAFLVRAGEERRCQVAFQGLFLVSMASIGIATMLSLCSQSGGWYLSGVTMPVMVVTAVFRPRESAQVAF
ncbi:MAG: hypothetical protein KDA42_19420 [Planctomycetales bacterium]|nr:hypothetical protein [Planctomycetales bacterium]